jgi:hypothetical protein
MKVSRHRPRLHLRRRVVHGDLLSKYSMLNVSMADTQNTKSKGVPLQSIRGQRAAKHEKAAGAVSSPASAAAAAKQCSSSSDDEFMSPTVPSVTSPSILSLIRMVDPLIPRPLSFELCLHNVQLVQLLLQYGHLYGSHWGEYDVLILSLAAVSLSRHLLLRGLHDAFSSRKKLYTHVTTCPYSSLVLCLIFIACPLGIAAHLCARQRYLCVVLCLLPSLSSLLLFSRMPVACPPDLMLLSFSCAGARQTNSGKLARPRLGAYLVRYDGHTS